MSEKTKTVNGGGRREAPLKIMSGFLELAFRIRDRQQIDSPNIGVMHGHPGLGKSYSSIYARNRLNGVLIEVFDSWRRRDFVLALLAELGVTAPKGTITELSDQAIMLLQDNPRRPLIVDEADKLVDHNIIELLRGIADRAKVPVLLVGEENLPAKLARFDRVHSRVGGWYAAPPCDLEDCRKLANLFLPGVEITDELLAEVRRKGDGRARRIVSSLNDMAEWARTTGVRKLDLGAYTGEMNIEATPKMRGARLVGRDA